VLEDPAAVEVVMEALLLVQLELHVKETQVEFLYVVAAVEVVLLLLVEMLQDSLLVHKVEVLVEQDQLHVLVDLQRHMLVEVEVTVLLLVHVERVERVQHTQQVQQQQEM
tara:strand:+ start:324 stop:653 length:330 start_codon:yes stop_codon:yes gene_type:complete